jgi:hypothetical protein
MNEKIDLGPKPRLEFHPPSCLVVDDRYQRSIARDAGKRLIKKITQDFYWPFFGVLVATDNGDGTYCLIDGQHRAEAARQHPDVHSVPVLVIDEMTLVEQAQAFVAINQNRQNLSALQLHHAAVRAGDPHAVEIDKICKECGVLIPNNNFSSRNIKPGQTLAVKALSTILKKHGADILRKTLNTVMQAYCETTGDLRAQIFVATALAVKKHPASLEEIGRKLGTADAMSWQERAREGAGFKGITTVEALAALLTSGLNSNAEVA